MNYETFSLTRSREANFTQESALKRPDVTHLKKDVFKNGLGEREVLFFSCYKHTKKVQVYIRTVQLDRFHHSTDRKVLAERRKRDVPYYCDIFCRGIM